MALIKCPKCNHEISDTSKKCIHCGTSLREKKIIPKKKKIILLVLVSLVIISIIAIAIFKFTQSNNKNDTINNYEHSNTTIEKNDTTNNSNDTKENISNNEDNTSSDINKNNQSKEDKPNNTLNNNNEPKNNTNNNNNNTTQKVIIDATKNESCPSGYEYKESLSSTGRPCQKMNIINGDISYYCLLDNQTLEGDKCKSIYTSKPVGGQCYNGSILNNGVCESTNYTSASTRLSCPSGYTKYNDKQCYSWIYESANISYSCPSGYTLNGKKCEK